MGNRWSGTNNSTSGPTVRVHDPSNNRPTTRTDSVREFVLHRKPRWGGLHPRIRERPAELPARAKLRTVRHPLPGRVLEFITLRVGPRNAGTQPPALQCTHPTCRSRHDARTCMNRKPSTNSTLSIFFRRHRRRLHRRHLRRLPPRRYHPCRPEPRRFTTTRPICGFFHPASSRHRPSTPTRVYLCCRAK